MPSPFPGMDPFLEHPARWPAFHHALVAAVVRTLTPAVGDRYRVRLGGRTYHTELPLFTTVLREEHAEEFVEVRSRGDGRLATLIDVIGPANKTTTPGRDAYLTTRRQAEAQRAGTVEIDLVTQGAPALEFNRDGLPEHDYTVTVTRPAAPERYEIYTATVQKRLPRFKVPLAPADRDVLLDLQAEVDRAFAHTGFGSQIDYSAGPPAEVKLRPADRSWLDALLKPASPQ